MKHLLAAASVAALLAAVPASAQVAYGMTPGENAAASFAPTGNWRSAVVIYASGPSTSTVLDNALAPLTVDAGVSAVTAPAASFGVHAGTTALAGLSGATNATAPVPEPAIWAMMMLGFAGLGATLRGRKATVRYA